MAKITKSTFIKKYAKQKNLTLKEARKQIEGVTEFIAQELEKGNDVMIDKFFNFKIKERKPKKAIDLVTRKPTIIPATKTVVASMTRSLKKRIQKKNR